MVAVKLYKNCPGFIKKKNREKTCCQCRWLFLDLMRTTILFHLSSFWARVRGQEK